MRSAALKEGITINGLPIVTPVEPKVADWYAENVIGGPGAFVVTIKDREKFKEAIHTKLVMEVAGRTPPDYVVPVADTAHEPRVSCLIGEKIWQDRWGR